MMDALISDLIAHKGQMRTAVAICRSAGVDVSKKSCAAIVRAIGPLLVARGYRLREDRSSYVSFTLVDAAPARKAPAAPLEWTDARIARLVEMNESGASAATIATEFGVTRNAIIGKLRRIAAPAAPLIKEQRARVAVAQDEVRRAARRAKERGAAKIAAIKAQAPHGGGARDLRPERRRESPLKIGRQLPQKAAPVAPVLPSIPSGPVGRGPVTLMDLRLCDCRWPLGDPRTPEFRFCGEPVSAPGRPYCSHHNAMAYTPRAPRPTAKEAA